MTPQKRHEVSSKFFRAGITRRDMAEYVEAINRSILTEEFAAEHNTLRAALEASQERERELRDFIRQVEDNARIGAKDPLHTRARYTCDSIASVCAAVLSAAPETPEKE